MARSKKTFISVSSNRSHRFYLNIYSPTLRVASTTELTQLLHTIYTYETIANIVRGYRTPGNKFCALYSSEGDPLFYFLDFAGVPHYYAGLF